MTVSKKITKQIVSKGKVEKKPVSAEVEKETTTPAKTRDFERSANFRSSEEPRTKAACFFCKGKLEPTFTDVVTLRKFLNDRSKIISKEKSGVCARHQRGVSSGIKHARHLALLPFVPNI